MKRNLHIGARDMVSQSVLIISWSKVSQCFNNYVCCWMQTDDLNKSSKIVDIFIYILFIVSYVSHILLDILWKLQSSLTLSANGNYLLGYNFQQRCLHSLQLRSVKHILKDWWKLPSSLTLLANANYLLGYNSRQCCLHSLQLRSVKR